MPVLCQHIIVDRDSEIAPTDGLLLVGGNSDSRPLPEQLEWTIYIGVAQVAILCYDRTVS